MKKIIVRHYLCLLLICFFMYSGFSQPTNNGNCNQYLPNQLIVELDGLPTPAEEVLLFGNYGGTVLESYTITPDLSTTSTHFLLVEFTLSLSTFSTFPEILDFYECNKNLPNGINSSTSGTKIKVKATDLNYLLTPTAPPPSSSGLPSVFDPSNYNPYTYCLGLYNSIPLQVATTPVKIAVVDSGQDEVSTFQEGISYTFAWDFVDNDNTPNDVSIVQHGTNVNAIIYGMLGNSEDRFSITPIKVLDEEGEGTYMDFLKGVGHAINSKMQIINTSVEAEICINDQCSIVFESVLAAAELGGILVSAAAGNSDKNLNEYFVIPASCYGPNLLVTGSTNCNTEISSFSNKSSLNVDLFAPGENIFGYNSLINGTSFSAPQSTAVAAAIGINNSEKFNYNCVKDDILSTVTPKNWETHCVTGGVLNILEALSNGCISESERLRESQSTNEFEIRANEKIYSRTMIANNFFTSSDQLIVKINSSKIQSGEIKIFSLVGNLVMKQSLNLIEGDNVKVIDVVQNLPEGIYIISTTVNNESLVQKCYKP